VAFQGSTQLRIRNPGQALAREHDEIDTGKFVLILPETLPHLPFDSITGNRTA